MNSILTPLSPSEIEIYKKLVNEKIVLLKPDIENIKRKYQETEVNKLVSCGLDAESAKDVVISRQNGELSFDDRLFFDHLPEPVSVKYVCEHIDEFEQKTLSDPLEPDYGGHSGMPTRNKAIFYVAKDGIPTIFSHAHGGQYYKLPAANYDIKTELLSNVAYLSSLDCFYDCKDGSTYSTSALNKMYANKISKPYASHFLVTNDKCAKANNLIFIPGNDEILVKDSKNRRVINTWKRNSFESYDGNIDVYLNHVKYIIPDNKEREHFLDWCAYVVQHRGVKINHALVIGGSPRIGKDALLQPLRHCIGPWMKEIGADRLKEVHDDWLHEAEVVVFQELKSFEGFSGDIENRLKPVLSSPPDTLNIRLFGKGFFETPNLVRGIFMTNYRNALHVSEGDERYFAIWSPAQKKHESYYVKLFGWLENGGNAAVAYYLMNRDVSNFSPKAGAPMTAYKMELIDSSKSALRFKIDSMLTEMDTPFNNDIIRLSDVRLTLRTDGIDASEKRIADILTEIGCIKRQCKDRSVDGKRKQVTLWTIRNIDKWSKKKPKEWVTVFYSKYVVSDKQ